MAYPYQRSGRHDSGVAFNLPQPCLYGQTATDPFDSDTSSSPHSLSSMCTSPSSSVASSPALRPTQLHSCIPDDLTQLRISPTPTQITMFASSVIRNEAYALLALAARIAPLELSSELSREDDSSEASSVSDEDGPGWTESRSNIAFMDVVAALSGLPAHGKIVVTGVGKSGIVGRKMVATFNSLGIQSVFLHPLEALHGDLGVICPCNPTKPCDALLLISHSGATAELMRLLPIVRARVRTLIAITRDPDSVLARSCTKWLDAGTGADMGRELRKGEERPASDEADCALPAPTSSVVAALAVGDALALCLSRMRIGWDAGGKERRLDFLRCHPGGQLGLELGREGRGVISSSNPSN